jgi:cyclopropane fatty-acyl-phospholipid synthase-like methyltransferase
MVDDTIYQNGTYLENNLTWNAEDSPWKARQIAKILRKNNITPSTVCEVGCGAGEILNCLANEYGDQVVFSGYEISPQAFELCKNKERRNLSFYLN